jgi:hypothetical protein
MTARGGYRENAILFTSPWRHKGGTKTIRVPVVFADLLLAIARGIDSLESLNIFNVVRTITSLVQEEFAEPDWYEQYLKEAVVAEIELYAEPIVEKFLEERTFDEIKRIRLLKLVKQLGNGKKFNPDEVRELDLPWSRSSEFIIDVLEASPPTERQVVVEGLVKLVQFSYFHEIAGINQSEIDSLFGEPEALRFLYYQRNISQPIYTREEFQQWQRSIAGDALISVKPEEKHK